jgi:hypothetical protein
MRLRSRILTLAVFIVLTGWGCRGPQPVAINNDQVRQTSNSDPIKQPDIQPENVPDDDLSPEWVKSQVEMNGAFFVSIVDHQKWPSAVDPNTIVVLGIAKQKETGTLARVNEFSYFPFVLLAQSSEDRTMPARLLGLALRTDLFVLEPKTGNEEFRPLSIDVTPLKIRENEYVFGVTLLSGPGVGNRSGMLVDMVSLYRYHNSQLKEIFRDAVWAYSKYSEPNYSSCNVEMKILSQPSAAGDFFTLTRQYSRSYLAEEQNPDFTGANSSPQHFAETPTTSCSLTRDLQTPHAQTWNAEKGLYLDASGWFLQWDDFGKGWPRP